MKTSQLMTLAIAVSLAGTQAQPGPSSFGRDALIGAWDLVRIEAPYVCCNLSADHTYWVNYRAD